MQALIAIHSQPIGQTTAQTVNARELHAFLGVGKVFAAWIQERIQQYGFLENQDYVIGFPNLENQKVGRGGDRRSKDYHLSLDMAKELAMVERNDKGRQARRYFIDCERRAKAAHAAIDPVQLLNDPDILRALLSHYLERSATPHHPAVAPPPPANPPRLHGVRHYVRLTPADWQHITDLVMSGQESGAQLAREYGVASSTVCRQVAKRKRQQEAPPVPRQTVASAHSITDAAKALGCSPRRLFAWLAANRWIYRRAPASPWTAYQDKLDSGWLQVRLLDIPHADGTPRHLEQVQVTSSGLRRLDELLAANV